LLASRLWSGNAFADQRDFRRIESILPPDPVSLTERDTERLSLVVQEFDGVFLREQWAEANDVLLRHAHLGCMLHAIYTADQGALDSVLPRLHATYGEQVVFHLYSGYCKEHGIPNRASAPVP
jgi:alpha-ketoglutarate-dependent taurine dioxygenase